MAPGAQHLHALHPTPAKVPAQLHLAWLSQASAPGTGHKASLCLSPAWPYSGFLVPSLSPSL